MSSTETSFRLMTKVFVKQSNICKMLYFTEYQFKEKEVRRLPVDGYIVYMTKIDAGVGI